jgi:hypothetical protein
MAVVNRITRFLAHSAEELLSFRTRLRGTRLDPVGRDLDKECGYIVAPNINTYWELYNRNGVASRIVNVFPDECWQKPPEVYEVEDESQVTAFEKWISDHIRDKALWSILHRADRVSGIGQYGVLLIGFTDGRNLDQPVVGLNDAGLPAQGRPAKSLDVAFYRVFTQRDITGIELESNQSSPRFGYPKFYNINFGSPDDALQTGTIVSSKTVSYKVHWTRIVHLADNRLSSEIAGIPRLQQPLNNVSDLRKVLGGSAEMFWKGAFPGYAFTTYPELAGQLDPIDKDELLDEYQAYVDGLQRILTGENGKWESLEPQIADPTNHVTQHLLIICATIGVPLRIFLGSEAAHLASTQDKQTWNDRLMGRNSRYLDPYVVRPVIDRLILTGVCPSPKAGPTAYLTSWSDLNANTEKDQADISMKLTQSLLQYVTSGAWKLMPPKMYFVMILRMTAKEADAIITAAGGEEKITSGLQKMIDMAGKNQANGSDPTKKTGTSGKRNGLG